MADPRTLRRTDGSIYMATRIDQYIGNGTRKSCAKCHQHKSVERQQFALKRPYGLCCKQCRGVEE